MTDEASDLEDAKRGAPSPAQLDHQPPALRDLTAVSYTHLTLPTKRIV